MDVTPLQLVRSWRLLHGRTSKLSCSVSVQRDEEWVLSQELAALSPLRRLPRRNFRPSLLCVYLRIHGILFKKYSKLSQRCFVIPQACRVSNKEIIT